MQILYLSSLLMDRNKLNIKKMHLQQEIFGQRFGPPIHLVLDAEAQLFILMYYSMVDKLLSSLMW